MTTPNVREVKRGSAHTCVAPRDARTNPTQNARERGFVNLAPANYGRKRAIAPAE